MKNIVNIIFGILCLVILTLILLQSFNLKKYKKEVADLSYLLQIDNNLEIERQRRKMERYLELFRNSYTANDADSILLALDIIQEINELKSLNDNKNKRAVQLIDSIVMRNYGSVLLKERIEDCSNVLLSKLLINKLIIPTQNIYQDADSWVEFPDYQMTIVGMPTNNIKVTEEDTLRIKIHLNQNIYLGEPLFKIIEGNGIKPDDLPMSGEFSFVVPKYEIGKSNSYELSIQPKIENNLTGEISNYGFMYPVKLQVLKSK